MRIENIEKVIRELLDIGEEGGLHENSGKMLIALIGHNLSKCSLELLEAFKKFEKHRPGSCEFIDGPTNPINISIEASERYLDLLIVDYSTSDGRI